MTFPAIILWKPGLSVGVAAIDEDHKQLVKMINRLFGASLSLDPARVVTAVLDELTVYVRAHLDREEAYMRHYDYPGFQQHQQEHQRLLEAVGRFRRNLELGLTMNLKEEIERSLRDWLVSHIQGHDRRLGQFLNQQGIY
ncbi:MAG: bacteriohemerythrin [Magnetococcus sp. MYC-9]